ncbi:NAD+ synthetase [Vibrio sp. 404]|uniref:NAD+ synthetase n=1 Tax=Vibrio marinisediminis TaxID=2758441 RepID=A0A7W2FPL1_9VIBR|nr:nitrilase-related carbon-nitrogen hydrolase [Vibrio marinisediminis]MBA5761893.1 NAD+ synthetase [Vibrio marinisediminis]
MKKKLKVAVGQIAPVLAGVEQNYAKHKQYILQAREQGADVLLFPELSLTGYSLKNQVPQVALQRNAELLSHLSNVAPEMLISVGFIEEGAPGEFYNAQATLADGKVVHVHRKLNLPTYGGLEEGKWYGQGQQLTMCHHIEGWPVHTLICADLWNPALPHLAMLDKPSLMLAPINSAADIVSDEFSNPSGWKTNTDFISMTYGVPVLMANSCALEGTSQFWGGSRILDAFGHLLAEAGSEEELLVAEVLLDDIANARFQLPTIRDANSSLVAKLLNERL